MAYRECKYLPFASSIIESLLFMGMVSRRYDEKFEIAYFAGGLLFLDMVVQFLPYMGVFYYPPLKRY